MARTRLRTSRPLLVLAAGVLAVTAGALVVPARAGAGPAPHTGRSRDSGPAVRHDTSRALRTIGRYLGRKPGRQEDDRESLPHPPHSPLPDPVVQHQPLHEAASPVTVANFDGVGAGTSGPQGTFAVHSVPPDPNAAVSRTQLVETVNTGLAVFDKSGRVLLGPVDTNSLWRGFGGPCERTNDGDAVVSHDRAADRWVIAQFANVSSKSGPYFECVAVSTTPDATGAYFRYAFQYANFPDYPKLSAWPDAFYVTYNMFKLPATFLGAEVCAMDRARMLAGQLAAQQCFTTDPDHGGVLAADVDSAEPPPAGEPETVLGIATSNTALNYYRFHVDWADPTKTTFTGPATLPVANFSPACGTEGDCVPQAGTGQTLDTISDRVMNRLAYRNFGDHESLVVTHSVTADATVGVRWYELRMADGQPAVTQQSTYAPDGTDRWLGSAAMDRRGDIAVGYSTSSASLHPGVAFSGRLADDPPGRLTQPETTFVTGDGSQNRFSRWGDYSSMVVDPADDCTFWYTNEYIPAIGSFNWRTRIGAFRLPGCGVAADDFTLAVDPPRVTANAGTAATSVVRTTVFAGSPQPVQLSVTGLPAGITVAANPGTVTAGESAALTFQTSATTPVGSYTVQVVGTGTAATHAAPLTLIVEPGPEGGVRNGGFEADTLVGWTGTGDVAITSSDVHGGSQAALLGKPAPTRDSTLSQAFTVPPGMTKLSLWYNSVCEDIVQLDWVTATLTDTATGKTVTILPNTCQQDSGWHQITAPVTAGHRYQLALLNHDDHATGDPTYTQFDDVALS